MEEILSLKNVTFDELYEAFNEAFQDYSRSWNKHEFNDLLQRRGFVPELSFGAFDDEKLVSFTFNCIDTYNGKKTAYDAGTGTLKAYRGKGLSTKIFQASIPYLKEAGVTQYLLEVLKTNATAISIYENIGFKISRELNYFVQNTADVNLKPIKTGEDIIIKPYEITDSEKAMAMWDFEPSWQNSFASLHRTALALKTIGAFIENELVGYGIIVPESGDIPQVAVSKTHRRKGIGTALFAELQKHNQHATTRIINIDANCHNITAFLKAQNIPLSGAQYEMLMKIV